MDESMDGIESLTGQRSINFSVVRLNFLILTPINFLIFEKQKLKTFNVVHIRRFLIKPSARVLKDAYENVTLE